MIKRSTKEHRERKRTWIARFKEVLNLTNAAEGAQWLEKEALNYQKDVKGITYFGAKMLIKANLTYLAEQYYTPNVIQHLKKVIGISRRIYG